MVYKIEGIKDLAVLPPVEENVKKILFYHAKILTELYGGNTSDGGYVLYVTPNTNDEEIQSYFDYRCNIPEYVEHIGNVCLATYVTNNEHVISIVLSADSAPIEITKEFDDCLYFRKEKLL